MESKITLEELKKQLHYCAETGDFTRLHTTGRHGCHKAGVVAGTKTGRYISIELDGRRYQAHRLAWLYVFGVWPKELDHINQNKRDNRICNLREVSRKENMQNVTLHKHNTSGVKGVAWHKQRNKWRAYIFVDYKQISLGVFDFFDDAVSARRTAEKIIHCCACV